MTAKAPTFHEDPGHGWLEVPMRELQRLGIAGEISRCSYQSRDGKTAYLEEDCDLERYLRAAGLYFPIQGMRTLYHEDDRIRNLPSYSPPMSRDAWSGIADALNPPDYGGAFDGFTVTSDADPGL
jgi:hypothetical protein